MDSNDQRRSYYTPHRQSCKWWWSLFTFVLEASILNGLILYNIDHPTNSVTHRDFLHTVAIKLARSAPGGSFKTHPRKEGNILLPLPNIRSPEHQWINRSSRDYCTVCKGDKTPRPSLPSMSRKRRAPFAEVNGNMRVEGEVMEEGRPIKKPRRQRPTQSSWGCSSSSCEGLAFCRYKEDEDCWSLHHEARFIVRNE